MFTLRLIVLSVLLTFALIAIGYLTVAPTYAMATESASETCTAVSNSSPSIQELWDILNGRYERRVGLPR